MPKNKEKASNPNTSKKQKEIKHNDKDKKQDKLTMRRLISNVFYVVKCALRIDKALVFLVIGAFVTCGIIYALFDTLFLKIFIDMLSDKAIDLKATLVFIMVGILVMGIGQAIEVLVENWARAKFVKMTGKIQEDFIRKVADIDLICYDHKDYFDDFVIAAAQSEEMITTGVLSMAWILGNITTILTLGGLIMAINPIIAIFPILGFLINMVTRFSITKIEYNYEMERKRVMRKADYSKRIFYQPEYAKEIKLSKIEIPLRRQFEEAIEDIMSEAKTAGIKIAILSLINWIFVFTFLSFFCVPMYLGYLALVKLSIGLGDVAAMNNAQGTVRNRLDSLNYAMVEFQKVGQFAERFRRFIEYDINIEGYKGSKEVPVEKSVLEIKDMSFRYEGASEDTLKHIQMTVRPGEKIAIVGENGAGKTTFVKLLMRLYDVTEGSICYGGEDIRSFSTKAYRDIFGAVFQDYQLYGATLEENVWMDDTAIDEDHIRKALNLADFGAKLERLPKGLKTEMTREFSDEGTMLSGGEAQKVAIARMFAKTGKLAIAILDEPSSALDPFAEYKLNRNMMKAAKDATIIFISHRLSTTREADRIYMFEHGEIIEQGTHDELMALKGEYAKMFEKQAYYYQEEITG